MWPSHCTWLPAQPSCQREKSLRACETSSLVALGSIAAFVAACGSGDGSGPVASDAGPAPGNGPDAANAPPPAVDGGAGDVRGDSGRINDSGGGQDSGSATDASVAGTVSFYGNWDQDPAQGEWKYIQAVAPTRFQKDPSTLTWHGMGAARVEVDPGDDPLNLGSNTERAEVLVMEDAGTAIPENESSGTQFFATSYKFPANWAGTQLHGNSNSWSIVMQLHGPDSLGASPAISLSAAMFTNGGPEMYALGTNAGDLTGSCCGPSYSFSGGSLVTLGSWTDLVMQITFASTPTGHIAVWRRDQGQQGFTQVLDVPNVATLQYGSQQGMPVGDHYWKQGLYRGGVNRVDVLWVGPTVRGTTFAAAEYAAFGTTNGP
jgi:hypothetical protein